MTEISRTPFQKPEDQGSHDGVTFYELILIKFFALTIKAFMVEKEKYCDITIFSGSGGKKPSIWKLLSKQQNQNLFWYYNFNECFCLIT